MFDNFSEFYNLYDSTPNLRTMNPGKLLGYPNSLFRDDPAMRSYVRILHAAPRMPNVDIYIDDKLTVSNFAYRAFTEYLPITGGRKYKVTVYPAGQKGRPLYSTFLEVIPQLIYTVAAIGFPESNFTLLPIVDTRVKLEPDKALVRFVHLSQNTPAVDITLPDGSVLFSNVQYKEIADYISVPYGKYDLQARLHGTDTIVLNVPNIVLKSRRVYTVYAVGLLSNDPPLQALIPLDGSSYLEL